MRTSTRTKTAVVFSLVFALTGVFVSSQAATAAEPVTEKQLVDLVDLEIGDEAIIAKIKKDGVEFKVDDAVLERLKEAGASDAVLEVLKKKPAAPPADAITYEDVLKLVTLDIGEQAILKRLAKSPTLFILGAEQETQLRQAGASDELIAALKGKRPAPDRKAEVTDIAIVLDCSGSMKEQTSDGQAKMDVAKRVVADLVQRIPEGLRLTFLIYGHDKELACRAVKVIRPIADLDSAGKSELRSVISGLEPVANTPIALALKTAGAELAKNDANCGLVLISDGKETCNGDPVAEAAALAKNLNLTFGAHVIGFDVDAEGRGQLEQVAAATGGRYYDVQNAGELKDALDSIEQQIEELAPEPPVIQIQKGVVSAILVSPLTLEGFPKLEEVYVIKAGGDPQAATFKYGMIIQQTKELGKAMVLSPGKYDVICQPAGAIRIALMTNVEVKARETVKINTNRVAAAVVMAVPKIEGLPAVNRLCAVPAGFSPKAATFNYGGVRQQCPGFGKPLLLTAGEAFDIVLEPEEGVRVTIAENVVLKGGELMIIGGEDSE